MTVIIVSGTPATGKTTIARLLVKRFGFRRIDVNRVIKEKHISSGLDKKRNALIIDTNKLVKILVRIIQSCKSQNLVIDSHLAHYVPAKYADACLVAKCSLKVLKKRLEERYPAAKVRENLDAEIFDICFNEAKELGHRVFTISTTNGIGVLRLGKLLKKIEAFHDR